MTFRFPAILCLAALVFAPAAQGADNPQTRCATLDTARTDGWDLATDFSWAGQAFDPAPEARARWAATVAKAQGIKAQQTARIALTLNGPGGNGQLKPDCYQSISCFMVLEIDALRASTEGADFATSLAAARQTAFLATPLADHFDKLAANAPDAPTLATSLHDRDQALRAVYIGLLDNDATPWLSAVARQLAVLIVRTQVRVRDISASRVADCLLSTSQDPAAPALRKTLWPIVQHADRNPEFQRRMLVIYRRDSVFQASPELALLEDRVELAATGFQVYGSQSICSNGRWRIAPVRDAETVDIRRRAFGLKPLGNLLEKEDERC